MLLYMLAQRIAVMDICQKKKISGHPWSKVKEDSV